MNTIQELIEQIKILEKKLTIEIQRKEAEFYYKISGRKVYFEEAARKHHKTLITHVHTYLLHAELLNILTAPVIWACLIPALFLDAMVSIYQAICFPVYKIPKVKRFEHFVIDRHALKYLNLIERANCTYCAYFNGLVSYVQEIAARTEQYWCPIKHARKIATIHSRYNKFLDYGDAEGFRRELDRIRRDFEDLR